MTNLIKKCILIQRNMVILISVGYAIIVIQYVCDYIITELEMWIAPFSSIHHNLRCVLKILQNS